MLWWQLQRKEASCHWTISEIEQRLHHLPLDVYKRQAWDVSSDISVLKTMFAQEGLTEKNNFQGKDN